MVMLMINTIEELLKTEPEKIVNAFDGSKDNWLISYCCNHLSELGAWCFEEQVASLLINKTCERIKVHVYKDHPYDQRRLWRLGVIYFDNRPVMVVQNAGREGSDHFERFIINKENYVSLLKHLINYILSNDDLLNSITKDIKVTDQNEEIKNLTEFYHNSLSNFDDGWY